MTVPPAPPCYTRDWLRTRPDLAAVYLPRAPYGPDGYNDHFLVDVTPRDDLLAIWTQGTHEAARDLRVVCSRSPDHGVTWSEPVEIAGSDDIPGLVSCFGFPVVSRAGRIYCFHNKNLGIVDGGTYVTGVLRCKYSDDDGITWKPAAIDIPYRRTRFDHPDPTVPCKCVVWQKPVRDSRGRVIVGFSRWSSVAVFPKPKDGYHLDSSSEIMRLDNIDEGVDPVDLEITWLPETEGAIRVACPIEPELYALRDRRFLLFFHNHDGFRYGATGPWDMNARRPLHAAVGEFRRSAHQPVWFSEPTMVCDTQGVGVGPQSLIWLAMYSSLTEHDGHRVFWYPDRKHFLLGRFIADDWLSDMRVPAMPAS